jgi:hypothetical protein
MNWKKLLLTIAAGSLAGSLGHYATELTDGHHIAFTAGNILIPALTTAISALAALFVKPPQQQ